MKGIRLLLAFVGIGWVLAGAGAGMSALRLETVELWPKVGPFLAAIFGVLLVVAAVAIGMLRPAGEWAPPAETKTDPNAAAVKPSV